MKEIQKNLPIELWEEIREFNIVSEYKTNIKSVVFL